MDNDRTTAVRPADRLRQVFVTLSEIFCIVGTLFGTGVIGTRVAESSGGALAADATLLSPMGPAFSIWSVIYVGLFAYTVWQWFPANTTAPWARRTGWLAGVSMILNAAWLLVTQVNWIWVSVLVIVALVGVLGYLMVTLSRTRTTGTVSKVVVDGTFGLYLGWVCVAVCANITAALVASGVRLGAGAEQLVAVVVLVVAAAVGVVLALRLGGRWAVAAAMAWGLAWIAAGRTIDKPLSLPTAVAAVAAALVVFAVHAVRARRPVPAHS